MLVVLHSYCVGGPPQGYCEGGPPRDGGPPQGYCVGGLLHRVIVMAHVIKEQTNMGRDLSVF